MYETSYPPGDMNSIVVCCRNDLESTRRCLRALARYTRPTFELIVVNDASSDGTATYLAGVGDMAPFPMRIIANADARGAAEAMGQGIAASRGRHIAVLDVEAVVTDGWLDQLLALVESDPAIGLAGAMSSDAPASQRVEAVAYPDAAGLAAFAAQWRADRLGRWFITEDLSGPCLLIKRQVLDAVAARAGGSIPTDRGLPTLARAAGFNLAVAHDLYVHRGPWPTGSHRESNNGARTRIVMTTRAEFVRRFGDPDTTRAATGYTPIGDTHAVLTLLAHARPLRMLEIGTAVGHMTANLTEWSPDAARVVSLGAVRGMGLDVSPDQADEAPEPADLGRLVGHFGKGAKAEIIATDTRTFDFTRLGPQDFAFIDGGHDLVSALLDSRAAYQALAPGGWLVWHDVGHTAAWIQVREAIEAAGFAEPVEHIEGTMVAFLRKGVAGRSPPRPRLVWEGDVDGLHSLGLINRSLCRALLARGVDLGLCTEGFGIVTPERLAADPALELRRGRLPEGGAPQVWVAHRWPPRLDRPPSGWWAFFQPWEYGRLPRSWLEPALAADEVWAYSRAVRDVYVEAGVPASRVHVVPLGVDPEVFRPGLEPAPLQPGPGFRFLFVGGTVHRKGIDLALAAYGHAFRPGDGVGLVVQDMGTRTFYRGQTAGEAVAALQDRGYPVEYREHPLPPSGLARLYAACDCAVQPYRGEGFALPVIEAMACGLAVIATGAGPALDYASDETAYLVPAARSELPESRVGEIETIGRPWLWEPDVGVLAELMRRVASDPAEARAKGAAATQSVHARFTWSHSAAAVEARLNAMAGDALGPPQGDKADAERDGQQLDEGDGDS